MSHSYCANHVHVVFSTKDRRPQIQEKERTWKYMAAIATRIGVETIAIGGMDDHLHMLVNLPSDTDLSKVINAVKVNSSRWMKPRVPAFAWQRGYAAFSVSASLLPAVVRYIENQERHHAKRDLESEFLELLRKHRVAFDPKYVFG
jgi:REP element-mobilizing transposase RayT